MSSYEPLLLTINPEQTSMEGEAPEKETPQESEELEEAIPWRDTVCGMRLPPGIFFDPWGKSLGLLMEHYIQQ
jgi:hypothetical protein